MYTGEETCVKGVSSEVASELIDVYDCMMSSFQCWLSFLHMLLMTLPRAILVAINVFEKETGSLECTFPTN